MASTQDDFDPQRWCELSTRHRNAGRLDQAVAAAQRALELDPQCGPALSALAHALRARGKFAEAKAAAERAAQVSPRLASAWFNLGAAVAAMGDAEAGIAAYRRALELDPGYAEAWNNLGNELGERGERDAEIRAYRRALDIKPDLAPVWSNLGHALRGLERVDEAVSACTRAVELDPAFAPGWVNLGAAQADRYRLDEAETACRKALELNANLAEGWSTLGVVLGDRDRQEEALAAHRRAAALDPANAAIQRNLGMTLRNLGSYGEARSAYRRALAIAPSYADAHINYSMLSLALGDFDEGWRSYSYRPARRRAVAMEGAIDTSFPESAAGATLLLIGEQGIGDELFFLRFAPRLKELGARLICRCDPKIKSMLQRAPLFLGVLVHGDDPPRADRRFLVGDLPMVLRRRERSEFRTRSARRPPPDRPSGALHVARAPFARIVPPLPAAVRLGALSEREASMRAKLASLGPPPYLGLTWRAGTPPSLQHKMRDRSLFKEAPLAALADTLGDITATVLVLQRHPRGDELDLLRGRLGPRVHDLSDANEDLEDMLALLAQIDEYVGVSSTNMHLMAGLGRTARVLVPHPAEWRWMARGAESPWFPGFALYRQQLNGDWSAAVARVADDLRRALRSRTPGSPPDQS